MSTDRIELTGNETQKDIDDALGGPAAAPVTTGRFGADEEPPEWTKEGTQEDDDEIPGEDISAAKPMERYDDWIEPVKGVEFEIVKAVIETFTPKDESQWKNKQMNVHLKVVSGIQYKGDAKPKYKGKIFFHRFYVAVNRTAKDDTGGLLYDFNVNSNGKETTWWNPSGGAFGDYNEFLQALGFTSSPAPTNNKAFREALIGRHIVYDIDKDAKEEYDAKTKKRSKIKGEFENKLRHAKPAKGAGAATSQPAAPAAVATADIPEDWK